MIIKESDTAVIGLGYVGFPLALDFCASGLTVIGFDTDELKVKKINDAQSYISYIPSEMLAQYRADDLLQASSDFSNLKKVKNIVITVPTPLTDHREPDLSFVKKTAEVIASNLIRGQLVVLESTTYPGTTREVILPILERSGLKVGQDFYLAYSPERVDPNNKDFSARVIPKVLGGITTDCLSRAEELYARVFKEVVPLSSVEAAEASKLLENIFRGVNIALVNELKMLFDRMGIDVWEVIRAASTKPFGFMPFYPGPGLGGHCIPIDPFYLTWKAKEFDFSTRFIELAGQINSHMPYFVAQKVVDALNEEGKSIKNAEILILGVAYKKDIDDMRESPALKIIDLLNSKKAKVKYHDPYIPVVSGLRNYKDLYMESNKLDKELLQQQDCSIIITDHSCFDYQLILDNSALLVDTRAVYNIDSPRIIRA